MYYHLTIYQILLLQFRIIVIYFRENQHSDVDLTAVYKVKLIFLKKKRENLAIRYVNITVTPLTTSLRVILS